MIACGVLLKGSEAIFAVLEQKAGEVTPTFRNLPVKKIKLGDEQDAASVRVFKAAIEAFARENNIDVFVIKARAKKGKMAGGGTSFKMEGVVQLIEGCSCEFVNPVALSHFTKSYGNYEPDNLKAYQKGAFFAAARCLSQTQC